MTAPELMETLVATMVFAAMTLLVVALIGGGAGGAR